MNLSPISAKTKGTPVPNPPQNHLGRPRQVLDDNNELVWQLTPTDFGGVVNKELQDKTGYTLNLRFTGQYFDKETGLYYNHHRYYDPKTGRYITPDPLGLAGGNNLYTYVNNSPVHYNDPVGLLLFAFDGTRNRDYDTNAPSNLVKFRDAYRKDPNEPYFPNAKWRGQVEPFSNHMKNNNIFYISGAGTEDKYTQIGSNGGVPSIWHLPDAGIGQSLTNRVDQMLIYMSEYLDKVIAERKEKQTKSDTHITLDIVGFSRGAASARMFASKLENLLSKDYNNKHPFQLPLLSPQYQSTHGTYRWKHGTNNLCGIKIKFNFMGLWDTVPSYGATITDDSKELAGKGYAITVSSKWNKVVHAVAVNEHRSGFAVRSIFNDQNQAKTYANSTNRIERGFLGAHSDIGGGYKSGDLSDLSLLWIIKRFNKTRDGNYLGISDSYKKNK
ncbi:hypothetical protein E6P70_10170 [Moraxella nonliquefaciens]|uniref:phospholipase effector Tle1 domain-containing protein n=1 Tax=Moraxella nonliquefaciens TaxID=478 RepID=UPI0024A657C9|nr:DUF2235 domain-containing protein [Moraxella nonliquefaciens]MDI4498970.1 hypothetical protein [Moraxella nonliquefaciens]MDI4500946.1 hypothetical protein [Moraxella nonliquefaciens]